MMNCWWFQGNIIAAEAHTAKANELRRKIESISETPVMLISAQEKSLRVCDICGMVFTPFASLLRSLIRCNAIDW